MQSNALNKTMLEIELNETTAPQHPHSPTAHSAAVSAALQSKHEIKSLKQNSIYKEYNSIRDPVPMAARPASSQRAAHSDGRMSVSLCVEEAASQQQRSRTGVWCPVDGTPYASLGQIEPLEVKLPDLYRDQAAAVRAAK